VYRSSSSRANTWLLVHSVGSAQRAWGRSSDSSMIPVPLINVTSAAARHSCKILGKPPSAVDSRARMGHETVASHPKSTRHPTQNSCNSRWHVVEPSDRLLVARMTRSTRTWFSVTSQIANGPARRAYRVPGRDSGGEYRACLRSAASRRRVSPRPRAQGAPDRGVALHGASERVQSISDTRWCSLTGPGVSQKGVLTTRRG
jgi:hypothetical protein